MKTIELKVQLEIQDDYLESILNFFKSLPQNGVKIKALSHNEILNEKKYELWTDKELEHISKVDLSTPLEDNEDYNKW